MDTNDWCISQCLLQSCLISVFRSGESPKNTIKIIAQMCDHASQWHVLHRLECPVGYPMTALWFCPIEI